MSTCSAHQPLFTRDFDSIFPQEPLICNPRAATGRHSRLDNAKAAVDYFGSNERAFLQTLSAEAPAGGINYSEFESFGGKGGRQS